MVDPHRAAFPPVVLTEEMREDLRRQAEATLEPGKVLVQPEDPATVEWLVEGTMFAVAQGIRIAADYVREKHCLDEVADELIAFADEMEHDEELAADLTEHAEEKLHPDDGCDPPGLIYETLPFYDPDKEGGDEDEDGDEEEGGDEG